MNFESRSRARGELLAVHPKHDDAQISTALQREISAHAATASRPKVLADVASIRGTSEMEGISQYNSGRVVDIYSAVQGRDLGGEGQSSSDAQRIKACGL